MGNKAAWFCPALGLQNPVNFHRPLHTLLFLSKMRAFVVNQYAHPSKIPVFVLNFCTTQNLGGTKRRLCRVNDTAEPVPKEGQVLCDVYTAYVVNTPKFLSRAQMNLTILASSSALNFFDILQTQGKYQRTYRYNFSRSALLLPFTPALGPVLQINLPSHLLAVQSSQVASPRTLLYHPAAPSNQATGCSVPVRERTQRRSL